VPLAVCACAATVAPEQHLEGYTVWLCGMHGLVLSGWPLSNKVMTRMPASSGCMKVLPTGQIWTFRAHVGQLVAELGLAQGVCGPSGGFDQLQTTSGVIFSCCCVSTQAVSAPIWKFLGDCMFSPFSCTKHPQGCK
jgi:tellurite resistance protein TehA-like permease